MNNLVIYQPIISEKSVRLGAGNVYTFKVDARANIPVIKQAVENLFKVKIKSINVLNVIGKPKNAGRRKVKRADWKKAVVTLMPGQTIKLFEEKKDVNQNS